MTLSEPCWPDSVVQISKHNIHYLKITCSDNIQQSQDLGGNLSNYCNPLLSVCSYTRCVLPQSCCSWFLLYLELCSSDFPRGDPLSTGLGWSSSFSEWCSWNTWSNFVSQIELIIPTCPFDGVYRHTSTYLNLYLSIYLYLCH